MRISRDSTPGPAEWHLSAFQATRDGARHADVVAGIRRLRARILFDRGRRPEFRAADGDHTDDQDLDYGAWHFVARLHPDEAPLGYIRLATPQLGALFQSRAFLGERRYAGLLTAAGVRADRVFEHSRLVVEHRARKLGLGAHLNAAAIAAAYSLGATAIVGTSGTRDGQDHFHERFGFRAVPGTRRYVEQYTEDVVQLFHLVGDGAGEYDELVARLAGQFPALAAAASAAALLGTPHRTPGRERAAPAPLDSADRGSWQPARFAPARERDREALAELLDSGQVEAVHNTIDAQLTELVRAREPGRRLTAGELAARVDDQLAGVCPDDYGTWVWYPWTRQLVHVLPREQFRLVRTDRNRDRIQRPQQRALLRRRIGVVGLSVGNNAAVTLALEGVGGAFKLADFDEFDLSNLNRLRAGVHGLGVNKAVLTARQMFEIDPYLDIEIYSDGLTDATMAEFFDGGSGPIDLLVEECDSPYIKMAAREQARTRRLPVVMDCSDRGMLDVERFDLEPARPLLHARLGDIAAADLRDLSRPAAAEVILAMIDGTRVSPDLAVAFGEVGRTLSSWPQLASAVALGGALVTEAARRILLGLPCESGRFYVDFDELLVPSRNTVPTGACV
jgi:hypothetical protein